MEKANSAMVVRDDAAQPHPLLLPQDLRNNPLQNISPNQLAQVKKSAMIECIKTFPALWDSNDPSAKNASYCKLLWDNISEVLKIEVRQAKINWARLRNSYKKYYLARKGGKKSFRNKWLDSLGFLENEIILELRKEMTVIETLQTTSTGIIVPGTENEVSVEIICCDSDDEDDCQIVETSTNDSIGAGKACKLEESNSPVGVSPLKLSANALNTNKPLIRPRKMEELLKLTQKNDSSKTINFDGETTSQTRTNNTDVSANKLSKPFSVNVRNGITEEVIIFKPTQSHADRLEIVVSNAFSSIETVPSTAGEKSITATPAKKRPLGMTKLNTKCVDYHSTQTEDAHQRQLADRSVKKVRIPDKPDTGSKLVEKPSVDGVSITQVSSTNQMAQETPKSIASTSMQQEPSGPVVTSSQSEEEVMLIDDDFKIEEAKDDNGNLTFLQSLLPDIYSMNFTQFRTFKKHSTSLASMILDL